MHNLQSVAAAIRGGADRLELCSALEVGGITPSIGFLESALRLSTIPVFVLIRPRSGHYAFQEEDLSIMLRDIEMVKSAGGHGIVSGVLRDDGTINTEAAARLIAASRPLPFTFHRAFDLTPDLLASFDLLTSLGADRILTSGGAETAISGLNQLKTLQSQSDTTTPVIMPGGGINSHNLQEFITAGFTEIHGSAAPPLTSFSDLSSSPDLGQHSRSTDEKEVRAMHRIMKS